MGHYRDIRAKRNLTCVKIVIFRVKPHVKDRKIGGQRIIHKIIMEIYKYRKNKDKYHQNTRTFIRFMSTSRETARKR